MEDWTCDSCQWVNNPTAIICANCRSRKGAPERNVSFIVGVDVLAESYGMLHYRHEGKRLLPSSVRTHGDGTAWG